MKIDACFANEDEILTWTGIVMDPFAPRPEQICVEDIAHALSLMVRANGHIRHFYSVAQHCLNCVSEAKSRGESDDVALLCLLHDASECYLSDLTRPVKRRLADYQKAEKTLESAVYVSLAGFIPTDEQMRRVADIDDCLLHHEFRILRGVALPGRQPVPVADCDLSIFDPAVVKAQFLEVYFRLSGRKK
jgi:hypothetical protein